MIEREDFKIKQRKIKEAYLETILRDIVRNFVKFTNSKICYDNFFENHEQLRPYKMEELEYESYLHTEPLDLIIDYPIKDSDEVTEEEERYYQAISNLEEIVPFSIILEIIKCIFKQVEKITENYKPYNFKEFHSSLKKLKKLDCGFIREEAIEKINNMLNDYRKEGKLIIKKYPVEYSKLNSLYIEYILYDIICHFKIQYELSEAFDSIIKQNNKDYSPDKTYYGKKLFWIIDDCARWFGFRNYDEYLEIEYELLKIDVIYEEGERVGNYIVSDVYELKIENVFFKIMKCQQCQKYIFDEKNKRRYAKNIFCGAQCKDLWHRKKRKEEGYYKKWYNKYYKRNYNTAN